MEYFEIFNSIITPLSEIKILTCLKEKIIIAYIYYTAPL